MPINPNQIGLGIERSEMKKAIDEFKPIPYLVFLWGLVFSLGFIFSEYFLVWFHGSDFEFSSRKLKILNGFIPGFKLSVFGIFILWLAYFSLKETLVRFKSIEKT